MKYYFEILKDILFTAAAAYIAIQVLEWAIIKN